MEHGKKNRKFNRQNKQRKAFLRSLTVALITNGKIRTTAARAKSLRTNIDQLVTAAKKNNLAATRLLNNAIGTVATQRLIKQILPKLVDHNGGYTRLHKLAIRVSDSAPMAQIEFINQ